MDNFDLIGALNTYATTNGWIFIFGDDFHKNYELTAENGIDDDQLILSCTPPVARPSYTEFGNKMTGISYNLIIAVGRKFESVADTVSSLDETWMQKYTNRLKELSELFASHITLFSCEHDLTITDIALNMMINTYDENADFVAGNVTLLQEA